MSSLKKTYISRPIELKKKDTYPALEGLSSPAIKTRQSSRMACARSMAAKNVGPTGISGEDSASASSAERVKRARKSVMID
jgi:hypothetical protein